MDLVKKSLSKWITSILVLVIGILCIVAGANFSSSASGADSALDAISMVLGITLIVIASLSLAVSIVLLFVTKKSLISSSIVAGLLLSVGIWFVVYKSAWGLISLTLSWVPLVLIVLGAILAADCVFNFVSIFKNKEYKAIVTTTLITIVAVAAIVIGALCMNGTITSGAQLIILGIFMILEAVLEFISTFLSVPKIAIIETNTTSAE